MPLRAELGDPVSRHDEQPLICAAVPIVRTAR
jgi:hypothetical protein